ncbi:hypothetical protein MFLAVUS_002257 [Mucor flavus]|uniref:WD40 repeat-like protein n=1 Tax=Mucor flavus TaxID=439312 RepID=A0ABP9YPR4_9FUNG
MESAEAFKREARRFLDTLPASQVSEQQLADDMSRLRLQRRDELFDGDNDYFNTLIASYPDIHYTNILAVAFEPQTQALATSSIDKTVKISTMLSSSGISQRSYRHHQAPDSTSVLVDTSFEADFGEDLEKSGIHQVLKDHQKYVVRGIFSPIDGKYMATASYDRTVCIYVSDETDTPKYKLIKQLGPFIGNAETICFASQEVLVIGVRDDNYLHYINLTDMSQTKINMNATGDDWVSFSPICISVSSDGSQLLCTTDHESGRTILRHVWHPSGLYFYASGGDDNSITVVETKTGRIIKDLVGHEAMIRSIVVDSNIGLISTGYDHSVKIWSKSMDNLIR